MGAPGDAGLLWGTAGKEHRAAEAVEPASWAGVMDRVTSKSGLLGLPGLSVAKHWSDIQAEFLDKEASIFTNRTRSMTRSHSWLQHTPCRETPAPVQATPKGECLLFLVLSVWFLFLPAPDQPGRERKAAQLGGHRPYDLPWHVRDLSCKDAVQSSEGGAQTEPLGAPPARDTAPAVASLTQ